MFYEYVIFFECTCKKNIAFMFNEQCSDPMKYCKSFKGHFFRGLFIKLAKFFSVTGNLRADS